VIRVEPTNLGLVGPRGDSTLSLCGAMELSARAGDGCPNSLCFRSEFFYELIPATRMKCSTGPFGPCPAPQCTWGYCGTFYDGVQYSCEDAGHIETWCDFSSNLVDVNSTYTIYTTTCSGVPNNCTVIQVDGPNFPKMCEEGPCE